MPRLLHRLRLYRRLLIASIVMLGGLGGLVVWQRGRISDREGQAAELQTLLDDTRRTANLGNRSREQAEELSTYMLEDLRDQLVPLGRTEVLGDAATRTLEYFQDLPPELATRDTLAARASILATLANVHHARGDMEKSAAAWSGAIALREELRDLEPGSTGRVLDLADALNEAAIVHREAGDLAAARAANKAALLGVRALSDPDPVSLAAGEFGLGECERAAGNFEGALSYYDAAISSLGRPEPPDVTALQTLMTCHNNSGFCHMSFGNDAAAEKSYHRALVPARELLEAEPDNRHWQKEIATLLNNLGTIHDERGDFASARPFLSEALQLRESLVAWDPANTRWQLDLVNSLRNLASLELSAELPEAAIEPAMRALRIRLDLLAREPGNTAWLDELQSEARRFADRFDQAERPDLARRASEEVRVRAEDIARHAVDSATWNQFLSKIYNDLSFGAEGGEALAARLKSASLRASNLQQRPDDPEALYQLAAGYMDTGGDLIRLDRKPAALACFQLARFLLTSRVPELFYRRELLIDLCIRREQELSAAAPPALVPRAAVWKYYDRRNPPPEAWAAPGFDDSAWESGPAELGYGDGDEATLLDFGPEPDRKNLTAWFRHRFEVGELVKVDPLRLSLLCDDGAVVYLNGREILRHGFPDGPVSPTTLANHTVAGQDELIARVFLLDAAGLPLREGANTLAVEVHQNEPPSSDLSFALELLAAAPVPDPLEELDMESAAATLGDALPPVVTGWVEEARRRAAP